jgi:hypothetical protein
VTGASKGRIAPFIWVFSTTLSAALILLLTGPAGLFATVLAAAAWALSFLWLQGLGWTLSSGWRRWMWAAPLLALAALTIIGAAVLLLRPDLLPQRTVYDLVANRQVTARLVDPALLKLEEWEIDGQTLAVLFVHPAISGSAALVYPVRIERATVLRADLAVAPEAWTEEGDGVVFSVYVEDTAGMHLLYSRYVDPKHHQQDRRWLPMRVDLSRFSGQIVRLILVTGSGPAGDRRFDWAGWGQPRLERPIWP